MTPILELPCVMRPDASLAPSPARTGVTVRMKEGKEPPVCFQTSRPSSMQFQPLSCLSLSCSAGALSSVLPHREGVKSSASAQVACPSFLWSPEESRRSQLVALSHAASAGAAPLPATVDSPGAGLPSLPPLLPLPTLVHTLFFLPVNNWEAFAEKGKVRKVVACFPGH